MLAKFMTGLFYTTLVGGAVLFHEGAITVNVQEKRPKGDHVYVLAPATLVSWGVKFVPAEHLRRMPEEVRQSLPAVVAAVGELEKIPDTVLVEVTSPREHVKVEKRGDRLIVDVDSDRETVHVSLPLRAVRHAVAELQARVPTT